MANKYGERWTLKCFSPKQCSTLAALCAHRPWRTGLQLPEFLILQWVEGALVAIVSLTIRAKLARWAWRRHLHSISSGSRNRSHTHFHTQCGAKRRCHTSRCGGRNSAPNVIDSGAVIGVPSSAAPGCDADGEREPGERTRTQRRAQESSSKVISALSTPTLRPASPSLHRCRSQHSQRQAPSRSSPPRPALVAAGLGDCNGQGTWPR